MTTSTLSSPSFPPFKWQDEKRIVSGNRIMIVTDVYNFESQMFGCSTPQQWYQVGALDLRTMKLGYFNFSKDDIRALLKAKVPPAPWTKAMGIGIELTRYPHNGQEKGRFLERVTIIDVDPEIVAQGTGLRAYFERTLQFIGNCEQDCWAPVVSWAARENAIESASLTMATNWFSAGDVKVAAGLHKDDVISTTMSRMVAEGLLVTNGKTRRGTLYRLT